MPDIKTALTTALEQGKRQYLNATISDWESHKQTIRNEQEKAVQTIEQPTEEKPARGTLNQRIFDYIKASPSTYTSNEVATHLQGTYGHNHGSALAAISQFVVSGMMARDDKSRLYALVDAYENLNGAYTKAMKNSPKAKRARAMAALEKARAVRSEKAAKRKKAAERAEKREAIKTLQGIAALTPAPTPVLPNLPTAESILNNMSIIEARKLYDELKKYFG